MKEGKGILTLADNQVKEGFWMEDEYIGEEKDPFKIYNQGEFIRNVKFTRLSAEPHQVELVFTQNYRELSCFIDYVDGGFGTLIPKSYPRIKAQAEEFPFKGQIQFTVRSQITKRTIHQNSLGIILNQPGNWRVTVDMVTT